MLLKTKGIPIHINSPLVGRVTYGHSCNYEFLITDHPVNPGHQSFKGIITPASIQNSLLNVPTIHSVQEIAHLNEGDIIVMNTDGIVNTLYRVNSPHNFLLFTERCNSNCLMCSQPPKDRDDTTYLYELHTQTIPLIPKDCQELGITGGEPTLLGHRFYDILSKIQAYLPDTDVHCLTNGRSFAWKNMATRLGKMDFSRLMLGIPLYSDHAQQHNYIVQAKDAFEQTIRGLYHLAEQRVRVELRIVLHQQTIPRLYQLSKFIYKNLPFVEHVTFMGLENQGYTPTIWRNCGLTRLIINLNLQMQSSILPILGCMYLFTTHSYAYYLRIYGLLQESLFPIGKMFIRKSAQNALR